ncbi:MAG: prolipoprotein diacylglyceryl transferase, partial [Lachnospiraceae bacterium]|nr:prolipoprotein diacylglyceryl transferase [Lachnospiraceae bacterium]
KHKRFEGEVFLMYFVGYGIGRFFIEGLRTDQLIFFGTGLAVSQILSAVLVIISIVAIFYLRKRSTERVYTK